jgi:hypothetical protein
MADLPETTSQAEATLRTHVRILAAAAGVFASCAVIIPQLMPRRLEGLATGMDAVLVFLVFSFLTFLVGVATPIYAYARAVKIGVRMPAAAFAPLALLVAAIIGMAVIGQLRKRTREVEFRPASPERPVVPPPTQPAQ